MFYLKQSGFNIDCVERKYMYIQNKRTHTWFKLYVLSIRLMTKTQWNSSSVQRTHCVGTCFVTFFVLLLKTFTSSDNPSILYVLSVIVYHPIYMSRCTPELQGCRLDEMDYRLWWNTARGYTNSAGF